MILLDLRNKEYLRAYKKYNYIKHSSGQRNIFLEIFPRARAREALSSHSPPLGSASLTLRVGTIFYFTSLFSRNCIFIKEGVLMWVKKKKRGEPRTLSIWYYNRPFKESGVKRSMASVDDRGVMEIYFNTKPGVFVNESASGKEIGRALKSEFGVDRFICDVKADGDSYARVGFYCRVESVPDPEVMEKVPSVIDENFVEAMLDRWDAKTGEYQGKWSFSEFSCDERARIKMLLRKDPRLKSVLGSKWRLSL